MAGPEMKSFNDFWPFYVREHSRPATRALHAAGTLASTSLFVALVATGRWRWLPLALVVGYAAAWIGHFFVEHNRPATFKHPLWSFAADYKMVALMLAGRMGREVERAVHARGREVSAR
ncbi:MAG: DUF962 domain-containing protein [Acidobacteria bacterium]|nr:DUF962 domain-containing protein [Acidobacteriota bacterium]